MGFSPIAPFTLNQGLTFNRPAAGQTPTRSVDSATERLEKRLRRYKRRLKSHGQGVDGPAQLYESAGIDYVIDAEQAADAESGEGGPAVIAETPARVRAMSVSDAVMQMDLADQTFLVFRNASHGGINVVYRRPDGNIGWIDPSGIVADAKP